MQSLVIIPARYASRRLKTKHLIELSNHKTLFQMTYEQCCLSSADRVIIATDHAAIFAKARAAGCEVLMTRLDHPSGTDRVAEVAARFAEYDIVLNVQGDEPLISPSTIDALLAAKRADRLTPLYSAMTPFESAVMVRSADNVKVVVDAYNYALYFSRAPLAYQHTHWHCYKHLGVYAFERDYLLNFPKLPITPLAKLESLEQLRVLERGDKIGMCLVAAHNSIGVDTKADLAALERLLQADNTQHNE